MIYKTKFYTEIATYIDIKISIVFDFMSQNRYLNCYKGTVD